MKKILLGILVLVIIGAGILFGMNGKSKYDADKYHLKITPTSKPFGVGSSIDYILPDQFDKVHKISTTTKRLIFVFTKSTGHTIKAFMADKPKDYLIKREAVVIADISGMPVIIQNTFALPDFRKSDYPMVLIYDKNMAKRLKENQQSDKIIVMTLENKKVIKVEHASSEEELGKILK